jgi:hypothetical protein
MTARLSETMEVHGHDTPAEKIAQRVCRGIGYGSRHSRLRRRRYAAAGAQTGSCSAAYSVTSDWGTGFTAAITVTDSGTSAITGWTLTYSYTGNQALTQGWSGNWSQSGKTVTVTNASYNGSLAAGASTQIGANFSYTGTNTAPALVTCTPAGGGGRPPPPGSITASASSLQVTQGTTAGPVLGAVGQRGRLDRR